MTVPVNPDRRAYPAVVARIYRTYLWQRPVTGPGASGLQRSDRFRARLAADRSARPPHGKRREESGP